MIKTIEKSTNRHSDFQQVLKNNIARTAAIITLMAAPFMNSDASLYDINDTSIEYVVTSKPDTVKVSVSKLSKPASSKVNNPKTASAQGWGKYIMSGINTQINRVLYLPRMACNMVWSGVNNCVNRMLNSVLFDFSFLILGYYVPLMYCASLIVDNAVAHKHVVTTEVNNVVDTEKKSPMFSLEEYIILMQ